MITTTTITHGLALLVIVGQAGLVLFLLGLPWRKTALRAVYQFLSHRALIGAFMVTVFSVGGSLYFSEVAKYVPCELCWYQRIIMYPQLALLGLALAKKNRDVVPQILVLSGLGLLIAIYHVYLQSGGTAFVPCTTTALAVPCGVKNFEAFGYITIPVMALTSFGMLLVATFLHRKRDTNVQPV